MSVRILAQVPLGDFMLKRGGSIDPAQHPDRRFILYSIPSFDAGKPDVCLGSAIGSAKKLVERGDVLLSRIVPHIRRSWIVEEESDNPILASGEWIVFRSKKVDGRYLRHYLVSDAFHRQFMQTVAGVGGSLLRANPNYVAQITIPLPPLDEQRRIAAILDKADALRQKRKQAIALLDSMTQAIFLEMFGDFSENTDLKTAVRFDELVQDQKIGLIRSARELSPNGDVPYLRMDAIQIDGKLNLFNVKRTEATKSEIAEFKLKDGDFLFNTRNSRNLVGKTAVFEGDNLYIYNNNILRIRFNEKVIPAYMLGYFRTKLAQSELEKRKSGTTSVFAIYQKSLASLPVIVPSISAQVEFRNRAASVAARRNEMASMLNSMDSLFTSLQSRAFSGQL